MPLLLLDLDNTLVDRDAAFRDAAASFLAQHRLPIVDLSWVMGIEALIDRYGEVVSTTDIHALLDNGAADRAVLAACSREALTNATADGWTCVIVTNGRTVQQEAKIRNTGLDQLVHAWVVSQDVGYSKPEPEIFQAAADIVGVQLSHAWVIGDSPHADIAGAHALGLRSVWVADGRRWAQDAYQPTHVAEDVATAINQAISTPR